MKRNVAKLWIKALTSGSYRQVDGALKTKKGDKNYGYCCLGVLCDLYRKETGKGKWEESCSSKSFVAKEGKVDDFGELLGRDASETELPEEVRKWAGMESDCGSLKTPIVIKDENGTEHTHRNLIHLNDDAKFKFKQIAEVIKANVATL